MGRREHYHRALFRDGQHERIGVILEMRRGVAHIRIHRQGEVTPLDNLRRIIGSTAIQTVDSYSSRIQLNLLPSYTAVLNRHGIIEYFLDVFFSEENSSSTYTLR